MWHSEYAANDVKSLRVSTEVFGVVRGSLALSGPPELILDANNIVFAKIGAGLNLDELE